MGNRICETMLSSDLYNGLSCGFDLVIIIIFFFVFGCPRVNDGLGEIQKSLNTILHAIKPSSS